ncbi:glycosyltransferase family 2 protein [Butyrivibrio fibrisolvens]|uniref:glycosyltransferase family 2 protein n=1 Tax=Butyrivibrio fibrisolvens TaxID=831 RepID=UPI0003B622BC|nr:glycosyltransferase [Butyrivibrio fibrisolvens]
MDNNQSKLISVIMSVYNEHEYISEAIDSLLSQTYSNFELIIIDDCSTDDTVEIIDRYASNDDRIKLYQNKENAGLTRNLNKALKLAKGDYIARMDGDDIAMPERFEKEVMYLESHKDVALVSCQTQTFGEEKLVADVIEDLEELRATMLIRPVLAHPGFMFRRMIIDAGFSYDESFRQAQDYDFAARLSLDHDIAIVTPALLKYRAHQGQVSAVSNSSQAANADRVRRFLLSNIGIELTDDEQEMYHKLVYEDRQSDLSDYRAVAIILDKILEANNKRKVYDPESLERALWTQMSLWIIRSRNIKNIMQYRTICGPNRLRRGIFLRQLIKTIRKKL